MDRHAWLRLAAYLFVVVVFMYGILRVEAAAREVHRETQRAQEERCRVTLLAREGSLEKDIRVWTRFGREIEAPQERIDQFIEGIREDYESLPLPYDCEAEQEEEADPEGSWSWSSFWIG